jgi:hypothetical protein
MNTHGEFLCRTVRPQFAGPISPARREYKPEFLLPWPKEIRRSFLRPPKNAKPCCGRGLARPFGYHDVLAGMSRRRGLSL